MRLRRTEKNKKERERDRERGRESEGGRGRGGERVGGETKRNSEIDSETEGER